MKIWLTKCTDITDYNLELESVTRIVYFA